MDEETKTIFVVIPGFVGSEAIRLADIVRMYTQDQDGKTHTVIQCHNARAQFQYKVLSPLTVEKLCQALAGYVPVMPDIKENPRLHCWYYDEDGKPCQDTPRYRQPEGTEIYICDRHFHDRNCMGSKLMWNKIDPMYLSPYCYGLNPDGQRCYTQATWKRTSNGHTLFMCDFHRAQTEGWQWERIDPA